MIGKEFISPQAKIIFFIFYEKVQESKTDVFKCSIIFKKPISTIKLNFCFLIMSKKNK